MMRQRRRKRHGFTLIELMVVVSIIGILATIAIPPVRDAIASAQAAALLTRLNAVRDALAASDWKSNPYRYQGNPGEVPRTLSPALGEDFFKAEAGVSMQTVVNANLSSGVVTFIVAFHSTDAAGSRALLRLQHQARGWQRIPTGRRTDGTAMAYFIVEE